MEGFKAVPYIFLALAVAAVIGGAASITMAEFQDTMTQCWNASYTYNTTQDRCLTGANAVQNASYATRNFTYEYYAVWEGLDGTKVVASQLGTVGVVSIMVVIIGLLAGVFVYLRYLR